MFVVRNKQGTYFCLTRIPVAATGSFKLTWGQSQMRGGNVLIPIGTLAPQSSNEQNACRSKRILTVYGIPEELIVKSR